MELKADHIFDSSAQVYETTYAIQRETDTPMTIFFPQEQIVLQADAQGNAVFFHADGTEIRKEKLDGNGRFFSRIVCRVNAQTIFAKFITSKWVDHYPHCDGEHDRWSEIFVDQIEIACPV